MCGIVAIYAYHDAAPPVETQELLRIRDHMLRRGPDGEGEWFSQDHRVGFGHRRLSIIDLSDTAAQPMASADGKYVVTFNGEIYNYKALRQQLEQAGYRFRTQSDTEVLLHLYAEKGEAMVRELRGMFAFAIWDADRRALFAARDPYGIKPLYYCDDGRSLRFASQVKALVAGGGVTVSPDPAGWAGYYLFGSVPDPHTIYQQIRALPAGTSLWADRHGAREPRTYQSIRAILATAAAESSVSGITQDDASRSGEAFRAALFDSVRHHLVADVPVGAFLSAGVDSGALVGLMRDVGRAEIKTVTLAFEEFTGQHDDEAPLAQQVAARYRTDHTTRRVSETEFLADLPQILEAMDQPSVDGVNSWFVSKAAHEYGLKVAVSGLGGDELVGGYSSFRDIPHWVQLLRWAASAPLLPDLFALAVGAVAPLVGGALPKLAGMLKYGGSYEGAYLLRRGLFMPWELGGVMDADMARSGLERLGLLSHIATLLPKGAATPYSRVAALEAAHYMRNQLLRDTDWASMAHSLEVRVPLVDIVLLEKIAPLMTRLSGSGKALLAASPSLPLPAEIVNRPKTGFSTPVARWLQHSDLWRDLPHMAVGSVKKAPWARHWARCVASAFGTV